MGISFQRFRSVAFVLLLAFSCASLAAESLYGRGLLFRIHMPEDEASYLFGTMHSEDQRVIELAEPVFELMRQTGRLVLEMELTPSAMLHSMSAMLLADGRDLQQIIGTELYRNAADAALKIGIPELALRQFKPWALATLLSLPPSRSGQFLDVLLYQQALAKGVEVIGLESAQEQLAVFDGIPEPDQVAMLEETLRQVDHLPGMFDELLQSYLARDLDRLQRLSSQFQGGVDEQVMQRFQQSAIIERNMRMAQRLLPVLEQGPAMIAIGALHLPGEQGVLHLLEQSGYIVEKVD